MCLYYKFNVGNYTPPLLHRSASFNKFGRALFRSPGRRPAFLAALNGVDTGSELAQGRNTSPPIGSFGYVSIPNLNKPATDVSTYLEGADFQLNSASKQTTSRTGN